MNVRLLCINLIRLAIELIELEKSRVLIRANDRTYLRVYAYEINALSIDISKSIVHRDVIYYNFKRFAVDR